MSERRQPGVTGSLPITRLHRRSDQRAPVGEPGAAPAEAMPARASGAKPDPSQAAEAERKAIRITPKPKPKTTRAAAKRRSSRTSAPRPKTIGGAAKVTSRAKPATMPEDRGRAPEPAPAAGALQTVVEAAVELTEIGLRVGVHVLRSALSRLPRP